MSPILKRLLTLALIAAVLLSGLSIRDAPADAAVLQEVAGEEHMRFSVFPHEGSESSFWDSWGARRSGGRRHEGIDIMSKRGNAIVAVAGGVVAAMGHSRMSGYFIRIQHPDDWMTVYMHLNNDTLGTDDGAGGEWTAYFATLTVGDTVAAGQTIGYVGDSGNAEGTRPHTHFELRHRGTKVNPYPYLRDVWHRQFRLPMDHLLPV